MEKVDLDALLREADETVAINHATHAHRDIYVRGVISRLAAAVRELQEYQNSGLAKQQDVIIRGQEAVIDSLQAKLARYEEALNLIAGSSTRKRYENEFAEQLRDWARAALSSAQAQEKGTT